jgi:hypothetical protein
MHDRDALVQDENEVMEARRCRVMSHCWVSRGVVVVGTGQCCGLSAGKFGCPSLPLFPLDPVPACASLKPGRQAQAGKGKARRQARVAAETG